MWFSHHDQRILASDIHTESRLKAALESCLPANEALQAYLWKIISRFEDAGAPQNPGSFSFGGLDYLCRAHCLLNSGHRLIALVFSPVNDNGQNGLFEYSDDSSSSINRMSDFDTRREPLANGDDKSESQPLSNGRKFRSGADGGDFFSSAAKSEVTYYYSLLPRSDEGHYKELDRNSHAKYTKSASSAVDAEIEDPDEIVPVVQPGARQFSSVAAEANVADSRAATAQLSGIRKTASATAPGHSCQECGTTQSPEWRKGPNGSKTLCNACGLRYAKRLRQR